MDRKLETTKTNQSQISTSGPKACYLRVKRSALPNRKTMPTPSKEVEASNNTEAAAMIRDGITACHLENRVASPYSCIHACKCPLPNSLEHNSRVYGSAEGNSTA